MNSGKILCIACFCTFLTALLPAQSNPVESEVIDRTISGLESISRAVISASFTPLTDYNKGELLILGSPGYLNVRDVYQTPKITGDPVYGGALGAGAGYALSDRLMVYGIFTGLYTEGTLTGTYSSEEEKVDGKMGFFSLFGGIGYELIQSEYFSLPLYIGLNTGVITLNLDYPVIENGGFTFESRTGGTDFLSGLSGGFAAKIKYRQISLTPYFLYMINFNGADFTTDYDWASGTLSGKGQMSHNIDPYRGAYFGVALGISSKAGWFYSLSLKNLFPNFLKKNSSDAVDFTAVILTIGFRK